MNTLLIKNGTVYTMDDGIKENTDVLIENGLIKTIGTALDETAIDTIIDASGKLVFPGFIESHCHVGLWEEGIGFEGDDINETTDPITPNMRAIDAFNPLEEGVKNALAGGITTACAGPGSANAMGGIFAIFKLNGHRVDDMVINDYYAAKCAFGENPKRFYGKNGKSPTTRMATAALMRETLEKTIRYKESIECAGDDLSKLPAYDAKLDALLPLINKEIPLKAHAHRADDIFTAIRIAKEFDLKLTLDHCTDGHLIADDLAAEGYPAIVGPSFGRKSKYELQNKTFETAGILQRAGVKVAIMTDSPVIPLENLPMCAALAHKSGMDEYEALKAITINPAEILEIDERLGSITVGKDADIVVWDGHPFDLQAKPEHIIVDGNLIK